VIETILKCYLTDQYQTRVCVENPVTESSPEDIMRWLDVGGGGPSSEWRWMTEQEIDTFKSEDQ
jgi:hypothetical protein